MFTARGIQIISNEIKLSPTVTQAKHIEVYAHSTVLILARNCDSWKIKELTI